MRKTRKKRVERDPQPPTQKRKTKMGDQRDGKMDSRQTWASEVERKESRAFGGMVMRNKYLPKAPLVAPCQRPQNAHLDRRAIEGAGDRKS
jgi:hypothetical protein